MSKLPSLKDFAGHAKPKNGFLSALDGKAAAPARLDLLTYLGAACAGLIVWNATAWSEQRAPKLGLEIGRLGVRRWLAKHPEGREMLAFLKGGGPETAAVKRWIAAGRKAWR